MPLDEYYYGKMEGSTTYSEEKGQFRFKVRTGFNFSRASDFFKISGPK